MKSTSRYNPGLARALPCSGKETERLYCLIRGTKHLNTLPTLNRSKVRARVLGALAARVEEHAWLPLLGLVVLFLAAALAGSGKKPLWHDELFTYYLAQAPSLTAMWADLRRHDLNPPLAYLLTRWSFQLFGVNTLATRLPELLFFVVMMLAVFRFTARRMGNLFGLFAVALLLLGKTFELGFEARPYTLLLGFLALALAAWQEAGSAETAGRRRVGLVVLFAANAGMLLSHIFSVPAIGTLVVAELWRSRQRRKLDWPVLAALMLPLLIAAIYLPMLRNHGSAIYPEAFQPTGETIFEFYIGLIERELIALLLTGLLVLLALGPAALRGRGDWSFTQPEWVAILGLLSLPLALMLQLMVSHGAFFARYGAAGTIAVVCLGAALLGRWTSSGGALDARAALLGVVIALAISDHTYDGLGAVFTGKVFRMPRSSEPALPVCGACVASAHAGPGGTALPLVAASGLTFIELNHNEPLATAERVFYLTDPDAGRRYSHANIFDQTPQLVERFKLPGHAVPYDDFLRTHPQFIVLGKYDWPEDWLLRKLVDDGASVRVLGRTNDEYRDRELYEVTTRSQ